VNLNAMLSSSTFFVTAVTARHRPIFRRESTASILIDALAHFRNLRLYWLHEFVVMPDHVHALITPAPGVSLEHALEWFEEGFSDRIGLRGRIWKRLSPSRAEAAWFDDTCVHDVDDYEIFRDHIRMNPVRSGLANDPRKYRASSAFDSANRIPLDPMPAALEPAFDGTEAWPIPLHAGAAGPLPALTARFGV
jgi:putative transposase